MKAFLFSSSGELLDSRMVNEKGSVTLKTSYGFAKKGKYKITVGPNLENIRELKKAGARSTSIMATIGKAANIGIDIYRPEWEYWHGYWYTYHCRRCQKEDQSGRGHNHLCTGLHFNR